MKNKGKGVANFETTPFELWRTRTGLPKKITDGSVCSVRSVYFVQVPQTVSSF